MFTHRFGVCDVKLWEAADINDLTDKIENIHHRLALLEEAIDKLGYKAHPVGPAKIDLSKMVPGQQAKTKNGGLCRFIGVDTQKNKFRFVFQVGNLPSCYIAYCEDGLSEHCFTDDQIVEILPLEGE